MPGARHNLRMNFPTTSWSMVIAARGHPASEAATALAALCQAYWYPLYEYTRNRGYGAEDARDFTQAFFARLIEKNLAGKADRERGRFRSFLLGSFKHFLAAENRRARVQKRGGSMPLSLDLETAESRYVLEERDALRPDKAFERRWALTLLDRALAGLSGAQHFAQLKPFLTGDRCGIGYSRLAADLGTSEGAVKVAVHRLRRRFVQSLREEVARTVATPEHVEEEIRYLLAVLQS
jgi:RNA polymerase sigma factor (sigma-70 family)